MKAERGDTASQLADRIVLVNPCMTPAQCVSLVRGVAGSIERVTRWRRGDNAVERADLPCGTPLATFQDRDHRPSTTYDASGDHPGERRVGCPGNYSTHAVVLQSYIKDSNGLVSGIRVWEQHTRSGPRLKDYLVGSGDLGGGYFSTRDASSYFVIMVEKEGILIPLGFDNPLSRTKLVSGSTISLGNFPILAIIDEPRRAFRNTGRIYLRRQPGGEFIGQYGFVTGGKGTGSAPLGVYDVDPSMMTGGELGNRWRIYQHVEGRDHVDDPGIIGVTGPSRRFALRIHRAIGSATEGCIGINGSDDVFADFERDITTALQQATGQSDMLLTSKF